MARHENSLSLSGRYPCILVCCTPSLIFFCVGKFLNEKVVKTDSLVISRAGTGLSSGCSYPGQQHQGGSWAGVRLDIPWEEAECAVAGREGSRSATPTSFNSSESAGQQRKVVGRDEPHGGFPPFHSVSCVFIYPTVPGGLCWAAGGDRARSRLRRSVCSSSPRPAGTRRGTPRMSLP